VLADLSRVVMGHVDRGILNEQQLHALARRGCVLEFDQFGWGCSYTHALQYGITYPSDFERCKMIKSMLFLVVSC
jgi:phosphotriesterase-related protein